MNKLLTLNKVLAIAPQLNKTILLWSPRCCLVTKAYPTKPKRPGSAFGLYIQDGFQRVSKESGLSTPEIMKQLSFEWRELSEQKKQNYQAKYEKLREAYEKEIKNWELKLTQEQRKAYNEDIEKKEKRRGKSLNSKKLSDPRIPKRPLNGYMLFCQDKRADADSGLNGMPILEQSSVLSKQWKSLNEEEKQKYIDKYHAALKKYNATVAKLEKQ